MNATPSTIPTIGRSGLCKDADNRRGDRGQTGRDAGQAEADEEYDEDHDRQRGDRQASHLRDMDVMMPNHRPRVVQLKQANPRGATHQPLRGVHDRVDSDRVWRWPHRRICGKLDFIQRAQ